MMALEFIDGMDHYYDPAKGTKRKYDINADSGQVTTSGDPSYGGGAMEIGLCTNGVKMSGGEPLAPKKTRVCGFRFRYQPAGYSCEIRFWEGGRRQFTIVIRQIDDESVTPPIAAHTIEARRGDANGFRLAYSADVLPSGVWHYIEIKLTVDSAAGVCTLLVNSESWIDVFGVNTQNTASDTTDGISFWGANASVHGLDDLYVLNTDGPKPWNDFLGNCRVVTIFPDSDSAVNKMWTPVPLTSANYTQVDDTQTTTSIVDDDSTYVTGLPGQIDTYGFNRPFGTTDVSGGDAPENAYFPLNTIGGDILAVQNCLTLKGDGGSIASVFRSEEGTQVVADPQPTLDGLYRIYREIMPVNPVTGRKWKHEEISRGEFGVKCVS